jgi:MerR family transcriptional regulator, mercuric resistance operon regulatory protein
LNAMTIGKLATAGGVGVETVRFYQRRGLLAEPDRNGSVRRYDQSALSRLRFIRAAQAGGFTLAEIAELLALDATEERMRAQELASTRIKEIDKKIVALMAARRSLRRLADECAKGGEQRCPIIGAFEDFS